MNTLLTHCKPITGWLLGLFLVSFISVSAQTIVISAGDYQVDHGLKLIVCNKIPVIPGSASTLTLVFDKSYSYVSAGAAFQIGKEYTLGSVSGSYKLYFTTFPIIRLSTNGVAISEDDNRTKGTVSVANPAGSVFSSSMGIRVRGNTSRLNPKKSYNMELWKDGSGNEEFETSLLGMRQDSKWLLLAMYSEPMRVNNVASWAIWLKMHQLYYMGQEPEALPGIRTRYCDVFINNSYNGVYIMTEDLDRKQLKLKKTKDNGDMRGELYKSGAKTDAAFFTSVFNKNNLPPYDNTSATWCGYEMDYPKLPYWNSLYALATFINKSPDADFKNEIKTKFRLDNVIDCFLFLNSIGATDDNFGNNQFIGRYKENEPYILLPWDFDVSFGNVNGVMTNVAENVRMNGFYYRLLTLNPDGFKSRMRKRWFALRQGELATANFKKNLTDNITLLTNEGAYKREELRWPSTMRLADQNPVMTWIDNRMAFLDQYFGEFPEEDPSAVAVTLASFTGQAVAGEKQLQWKTSLEKDASRFEIEFSTNGLSFSKVGQVAATGNSSSEKTYPFTHSDASTVAYYRLKIVNKDELYKYSEVVLIGSCLSPPAPPSLTASLTAVNTGQSTVLKATGCASTVLWNSGQTGTQLTVSPTTTTTYQARCRSAIGCESAFSQPMTINVNVPTALDGYLSSANCTVISGWAWDGNKPNKPVVVEILEGQNVISLIVADIFRTDLKSAGKGNGLHAYAFEPPRSLYDNKPHVLSARVQGSTFVLKQAPKTVTCPNVNVAPLAPTLVPLSATVNAAFSWTLPMFFDQEYGSVFYSLAGLPHGLSFEPITRKITGIPTVSGTFSLTYSANDGNLTTPVQVTLIISDSAGTGSNQPPQAPAMAPLSATVNAVFSTTLPPFTDTDPMTYSLSGLPNELKFTAASRSISGKPTVSGTFSLTYTANDGLVSTSVYVSLTVSNSAVTNQPPLPPSTSPLSATVNTVFSAALPPFIDTDPLTYDLTGLPNGLSFAKASRTLSGTPTTSGTFSLTYTANDGQVTTPVYISLVVSNSATLSAPTSVTGNFEGYLDKVECGTIRGWVWDRNKPNTVLTVEFFANNQSIGTANADIFRQDLVSAGKGNGYHVYSFPTPSSVKTGATFQISAKVQNSTFVLSWAPKPLSCPAGSRLNGDDESGNELTVWPNPTDGNFEIGYRLDGGKPGELVILDVLGRSWFRKTVEGEGVLREKVSLVGANGFFLIQLRQKNSIQSKKISIGK
ncbi:CotH kinase family protein [Larkinella rosea]|uniref:T9SS C-terminal target domain-containing protein n=1 Tax=Larkinella rosea TaxID=2025312 RepID=A0A3P1C252_9BACT|nr:CotH kinase family protein [Larkinella rosea]RRB07465.1 hypothetical protein EHT25_06705 [Larkinella rosea]